MQWKKTITISILRKHFIFLFVTNFYLLPIVDIGAQEGINLIIQGTLVGVDNTELIWNSDFEVQIFADGKLLTPASFQINEYSDRSFEVSIRSSKTFSVLLVQFDFRDYRTILKNIRLYSDQTFYDLGKIQPEANELMVSAIDYEEITEGGENYMDFVITFRNNSREEILVKQLSIETEIEISCLTPNPVFAKIIINNTIGYLSPTNEVEFSGTFTNSDKVNEDLLVGRIIYNDCGQQYISLGLNLSFIIPKDRFSKMLIRMPNELTFYNHEIIQTSSPSKLSITKKMEHPDALHSLYQLFKKIPEIKFEFDLESNVQQKVYSVINDLF